MTALRGRLIGSAFARHVLPTLQGFEPAPPSLRRDLERWSERRQETFGPSSSRRALADGAIVPLLRILGFTQFLRTDTATAIRLDASLGQAPPFPVQVVGWADDLQAARRNAILLAIASDSRWGAVANGQAVRVFDARRTWAREYLEVDFDRLADDEAAQAVIWNLLGAASITTVPSMLDVAASRSAEYTENVCRALGDGVLEAMRHLLGALAGRRRHPRETADHLFEQSLTVVYRILFLLFAEARGLVPVWHPVYRDRYTIDAIVDALVAGRRYRGIWAAIQAISRMAHAGCAAGDLRVTAFNGRLFSPAHAPAFERPRIHEGVVADAVLAVATTYGRHGRTRIGYGDLDVEQLGAVYEHVLEYRPGRDGADALTRDRDRRQASGTFYTPRTVTAFLVREALTPLVEGRTAEDILALRVLDPAMGSGAFLVSACRFLARATEEALIREGRWHPGDVSSDERAGLRRDIALRCLFGVDINPVAVQLARLSLWLTTLAADKPLTFLDHHLVVGNSLVGASPHDTLRQPGVPRTRRRPMTPTLFDEQALAAVLKEAAQSRGELTRSPDSSANSVRDKERRLAAVHHRDSPLGRWSRVLDLWCAGWFGQWDTPLDHRLFGELTAHLLQGRGMLPDSIARPMLEHADAVARHHRFLHWILTFPEVLDPAETAGGLPGFDAVIGNPPWDMVRGDSGEGATREGRREDARRMNGFVRESGVYRIDCRSHLNRYVLFLERALQLTRPGGRLGLLVPAGLLTDTGTTPVRRYLFDHASIDALVGLDNRAGIFPIHRSVRFVIMTGTTGATTDRMTVRFGLTRIDEFDTRDSGPSLALTRAFLARTAGDDDLGVPELTSEHDLRILEKITAGVPCASAVEGWNVRFGRELNASDDRAAFAPATGTGEARPVVEGKQLEAFHVALERVRYELREGARCRIARRTRLAYRDVAGATNRMTLIAALVPGRAVTTHTVFCLKTPLALDAQYVLCALFNSFVANYLIRLRVSTHVTTALVGRLRLPVLAPDTFAFGRLAELARRLSAGPRPPEGSAEFTELQALVACTYGLTTDDFAHILSRFPLVPPGVRQAALSRFAAMLDGTDGQPAGRRR